MKPRPGSSIPKRGEGRSKNSHPVITASAAPSPAEIIFIRREECRKCDAMVWAVYYFAPDGDAAGWGCRPIGECGNPDRCGEKLQWLDDGDLALSGCRVAGAA
jgi:hypothetical protein